MAGSERLGSMGAGASTEVPPWAGPCLAVVGWMLAGLGCSGPSPPPVVAPMPVSSGAEVLSRPSKPPSEPSHLAAPAAEPEPWRPAYRPKKGRFLRITVPDHDVDEPCDFTRAYSGTMGGDPKVWGSGTTVELVLKQAVGGGLVGATHYSTRGPGLPVTGRAQTNGRFSFRERGGGTFTGVCEEGGRLEGDFVRGGKTQPFHFFPHRAGRPALYQYTQSKANPPCELTVRSLGYFGGTASLNQKVTRALSTGSFRGWLGEVSACKDYVAYSESSHVAAFGPGFISLERSTSTDYGGAHPLNGAGPGGVYDLKSGRYIFFADIITDETPLRELMPECIDDFDYASARDESDEVHAPRQVPDGNLCDAYPHQNYLWFCDGNVHTPNWLLTVQGVAIVARGHVHAEAFRDGNGPIINWATLKRLGVLKSNSPMKHLWADVVPAKPDDLACTDAVASAGIVHFEAFVRD